jgi:dihydroxyacetone kinase DhaKLM complex PTS-EIIA-like component DhaM
MSRQTAVDFLIEELGEYFPHEIGGIHLMVEQAKEMEKQQIMKAFLVQSPIEDGVITAVQKAEQYYNETFNK